MGKVTVTPETYELVEFDAGEIHDIASEMAKLVDLGDDVDLELEVDEVAMMPNVETEIDGKTIRIKVTGGAFEDQRKARTLSADRTKLVLGTALLRAKDRMKASWADAPANEQLTVQQSSAWDTYTEGRLARVGLPARPQRRIYHFRLRHGFADSVDAIFHRLWNGQDLSWADIEAACQEAAAANARSLPAS